MEMSRLERRLVVIALLFGWSVICLATGTIMEQKACIRFDISHGYAEYYIDKEGNKQLRWK